MENFKGFGRLSKKGVSHIAVDNQGKIVTLCGKKLVKVDPELNITHVNCGNCQRLSEYAELVEKLAKKQTGTIKVIIDDNGEMLDFSDLKLDSSDERINIEELRKYFINTVASLDDQFTAIETDQGFDIVHRLSGHVLVPSVDPKYISSCLLMMNRVDGQWTGRDRPSKNWIDSIQKAFSVGYGFVKNLSYDESDASDSKDQLIIDLEEKIKAIDLKHAAVLERNHNLSKTICKLRVGDNLIKNSLEATKDLLIAKNQENDSLRKEIDELKNGQGKSFPLLDDVVEKVNDLTIKHNNFVTFSQKGYDVLRNEIDGLEKKIAKLQTKLRISEKTSKENPPKPDNVTKRAVKKINKIDLSNF